MRVYKPMNILSTVPVRGMAPNRPRIISIRARMVVDPADSSVALRG